MSENVYGEWKRRFPILKSMSTKLELSQKVIIANAVLFNIGRQWGDDLDDDESDEDASNDDSDDERDTVVVQDGDPASTRVRGQVERDRLKEYMV